MDWIYLLQVCSQTFWDWKRLLQVCSQPGWIDYICSGSIPHLVGFNISAHPGLFSNCLDWIHLFEVYSLGTDWIEYKYSKSILHLIGLNISFPGLFSNWVERIYRPQTCSPPGWIKYICYRYVLHLAGLNISAPKSGSVLHLVGLTIFAPGLFSTWLD